MKFLVNLVTAFVFGISLAFGQTNCDMAANFLDDFAADADKLATIAGRPELVDAWRVLSDAGETNLSNRFDDIIYIENYVNNNLGLTHADVKNAINDLGDFSTWKLANTRSDLLISLKANFSNADLLNWIDDISDNSILIKLADDIDYNPSLINFLNNNPSKRNVWELIHKSAYSSDINVLNYVDNIKDGAKLGSSSSTNYTQTFFDAFPNQTFQGNGFVVHHAIEQQVLTKYPGLFTVSEINSLKNLRGVSPEINGPLHLSNIRIEWNKFYNQFPNGIMPTRQQVIDKATEIDNMFGALFTPSIRSL